MIKIYTLSSSKDENDIRYVGKTKQSLKQRLNQHLCAAKRSKNVKYVSNYNYNWINKELSLGNKIIIKEIDSLESDDWKWLEQYWISQIKVWGFRLTNLTNGGDGNQNQIFSKESLLKRSKSLTGRKRSKDECKAISKGLTGRKLSTKHKLHVSESIKKLQGKDVYQFDINGKLIKHWNNIIDAANYYKIDAGNIIKCCKYDKNHKTCNNFVWRYTNELINIDDLFKYKMIKDGKIYKFNSLMQFAKDLNLSYTSLYQAFKANKQYKGYTIIYNK